MGGIAALARSVQITLTRGDKTVDVDAAEGSRIFQVALDQGLEIPAACGGNKVCGGCHCYVEPFIEPKDKEGEADVLEDLWEDDQIKSNSRLGCQITVTADMAGTKFEFPLEE
ncbi:2Fe-2S iron-sulfur cluster binding domain-containing protein [Aduncisulcus paluster]|uniref:2Fe-2S iron-sulfur cluster binding domain-containing protein n=1 Tax=Aduncisulcus paluster TaxID=2918883 RepID=A0ABQ5K3Z1_9EUKA|nr:2Fe-2S iron-sulfur cluster binding domain-containing protein [Aduncisulcus paluster]